ncbi:6-pyruvoyl trahydropterin synthase family protein [Macrococcus equi]|uniref:6-pyruvoyl trahydropterin synthase family protein n=1 Tax=Macrococcus equi TaxID=3395462 RepID=UPI0039BDF7AA
MTHLDHITKPQQTSFYQRDILINLKFKFTTNNRIFFPNGKHKDLFHHTYHFEISIMSPVDQFGLGIDFYKIEQIYNDKIAPQLNAPVLNEALPEMNTTVENIAYYIWQQFEHNITAPIHSLTLYETKNHSVTLNQTMFK